ncbi:unnamed protein product [Microthlaspi erraticum]|uniref:Uncharacterized protein n=1 Tax=Microthlaspi erraticum TaxID=1685480 RepID=A0A6D2HZU8_9BRAS|nr:unnamed protein product [Microthlaspi erraticum]
MLWPALVAPTAPESDLGVLEVGGSGSVRSSVNSQVSPLWSLVPARSGFSPPFPLSLCASMLRPAYVEFAWVLVFLRFDLSPSELGVIRFGSFAPCRYLTSDRELNPRRVLLPVRTFWRVGRLAF